MGMKQVLTPGMVLGRLALIEKVKRPGEIRRYWRCRCACGTLIVVSPKSLQGKRQNTKSCGCLKREVTSARFFKHGHTRGSYRDGGRTTDSAEYRAWCKMKARCRDKSDKAYQFYGGRGITVCERWINDFSAFITDMGLRPSKNHSLDRINTNGNYEPINCRWATKREQTDNRRPIRRPLHRCPNCGHEFRH